MSQKLKMQEDLKNNTLIERIIELAFEEDIQTGDITTNTVISENSKAKAVWVAKEEGVIAGLEIGEKVFRKLDKNLKWNPVVSEGDHVTKGDVLVNFSGTCRALLSAERIALNFVQRMSGIATHTKKIVKKLNGHNSKILDTRKTVPGLRILDKYAVAAGGGSNHRMGLFDMAMIKDNHIIVAGGISQAVQRIRNIGTDIKIEVETTNLDEVDEALKSGADVIMLDNMSIEMMKVAVDRIGNNAQTEASGNISIQNISQIAGTGVDFISMGALTHSVKAFDISQKIQEIL